MSTEEAIVNSTFKSFMEGVITAMDNATDLSDELYGAVTKVATGHPVFEVCAALLLVAYKQLHHGGQVGEIDGARAAREAATLIRQGSESHADVAATLSATMTTLLAQFLTQSAVDAEVRAVETPQGSA
jgi:hypothetical protein